MKLEDLVPPLKLCQKIPVGEFEDSALLWVECCKYTECRVFRRNKTVEVDFRNVPAPTLQEIMADLAKFTSTPTVYFRNNRDWIASTAVAWNVTEVIEENPVNAALKLWLKMKGVESE